MSEPDRRERLESWKEIAVYLRRGVSTVQRWEQQEGLPVHRLPHAKKGSIFAIKSELDAWWRARAQLGPLHDDAVPAQPRRLLRVGRRSGVVLAALFALAVIGLAMSRVLRQPRAQATAHAESSIVPRPLANDARAEGCPSLSPDGSRVVYFWGHDPDAGLYIKPIDGTPQLLPTSGAGDLFWCGWAKWSPAGDLIAFLAKGDGDSKNIWVIPPAGGLPRLVTSASGIGLAWTPDGKSLAFVDRNSSSEPFSIFSIPLRGGPRRRLTRSEER